MRLLCSLHAGHFYDPMRLEFYLRRGSRNSRENSAQTAVPRVRGSGTHRVEFDRNGPPDGIIDATENSLSEKPTGVIRLFGSMLALGSVRGFRVLHGRGYEGWKLSNGLSLLLADMFCLGAQQIEGCGCPIQLEVAIGLGATVVVQFDHCNGTRRCLRNHSGMRK